MALPPLISVIVPCYNQAQYMDECLQSVLDQTYTNWECIIVNDGSPDHTEEIALQWRQKDSRFKYLKKENGGLSSARNAGIEVAKGEWIQFLDCDDKLDKNKFVDSSKFFDEFDLVISDYQLFSEDAFLDDYCDFMSKEISLKSIILDWDIHYSIPIHCGVFKKEYIRGFNPILKAKEDWLFWIKYFEINPKVKKNPQKLAYYRIHEKSMTKDLNNMLLNEEKVYKFIYEYIDESFRLDFFSARVSYKNQLILRMNDKNILQDLIIKKFRNTKKYIFIDKLFGIFNI